MATHPSLSAPTIKFDPIVPVKTMGPYEQCWCRSGKKYKWCHYRREKQTPINLFEAEAEMLSEFRRGYCSYPDPIGNPCSSTISKAHTIQKKGGLAAIAEAGHVLTVKPTMKNLIEAGGIALPHKIGVNKASVFPGFCGKHDDEIFKPIEGKALWLTVDTAFLFSYRAIAYERFSKVAQLKVMNIHRDADKGQPFWKQVAIQEQVNAFIAGIRLGLRDVDNWEKLSDERLLSGARDDFHFLAIRFDQVLPIVACGAFHPEFDFQGNQLQQLGREGEDFDHITLTVTAFEGNTILVLGWIGDEDSTARALAESYLKLEDSEKADALVRLLFIHTDNVFIRPSWWDSLGAADRDALSKMTMSGTPMQVRSGREIADANRSMISATVLDAVFA